MIDMFKDVWDAMTPEQRKGIAWLAIKEDRTLGEGSADEMMRIAIAACDSYAKAFSEDYEDYQEHVMAFCKGMAQGLFEGGEDHYLEKTFG